MHLKKSVCAAAELRDFEPMSRRLLGFGELDAAAGSICESRRAGDTCTEIVSGPPRFIA